MWILYEISSIASFLPGYSGWILTEPCLNLNRFTGSWNDEFEFLIHRLIIYIYKWFISFWHSRVKFWHLNKTDRVEYSKLNYITKKCRKKKYFYLHSGECLSSSILYKTWSCEPWTGSRTWWPVGRMSRPDQWPQNVRETIESSSPTTLPEKYWHLRFGLFREWT